MAPVDAHKTIAYVMCWNTPKNGAFVIGRAVVLLC